MSPRRDEAALIEAVLGAYRERNRDGLPVAPPEWWDLPRGARVEAYHRQIEARFIESALDENGWSGTVRAVMERIEEQRG